MSSEAIFLYVAKTVKNGSHNGGFSMKNKTVFSLVTLVALLGALNIQGADRGITGRPSIGTQQEMDAASAAVAAVSARKNDVIAQLQAQLAAAQAQIAEFQEHRVSTMEILQTLVVIAALILMEQVLQRQ